MSAPVRQTIMLKPMQAAASGYARLQSEGGRTIVQVHARGLSAKGARLFWHSGGRSFRELGHAQVNAHGESSFEAAAPSDALSPERLQALMVISDDKAPSPLLIGLCVPQHAGRLMEAKNAALALCDQLRPRAVAPTSKPVPPVPVPKPRPRPSPPQELPREIFLPAIDPSPYMPAKPVAADAPEPFVHVPPPPAAPPVDRLRPLQWPHGFDKLRPFFEKALPCRLFDLPGWRFVYAAHAGGPDGLWLGMQAQDGRVRRLAYVQRSDLPPKEGSWQPMRGLDGMTYQVMWQKI